MSAITGFTGDYAFLSNNAFSPIWYEGVHYATVTHAYEAQRTRDRVVQCHIAAADTTMEARKRAAPYTRANWDKLRHTLMWDMLCQKFAPGSELLAKLIATAPRQLVNATDMPMPYWGVTKGTGQNALGILLMEMRQSHAKPRGKRA